MDTFTAPEFRQRLDTYLGKDSATQDKDIYRLLLQRMHADDGFVPASALDMGCATGDLLACLARHRPSMALTGLDVEPRLIETARARPELAAARLLVGDLLSADPGPHDLVTCFGVLGIFDAFEPVLEKLVGCLNPDGRLFVQALLNPDDIEVRIAYRDHANGLDWMRGFNIFPRRQIAEWAARCGYQARFHDFRMQSELPKRAHLPHRAHTIDLADGTRRTTNGLCLLLPETLLEIRRAALR